MFCPNINTKEWNDLVKAVGEPAAYYLWNEYEGNVPNQYYLENNVNYNLKSVEILSSDKAKQVFSKGEKVRWDLNKILTELQIPKPQKELILSLGKTKLDDIITDLLVNYSYTVEINTAINKQIQLGDRINIPEIGDITVTEEVLKQRTDNRNIPSQYYSNLTVPGGTNYTENEIATPAITPSIKGHAQFATDKGIGWFRSDEQLTNKVKSEKWIETIQGSEGEDIYIERRTKDVGSKTRRILEVQSDLFQKGREFSNLTGEEIIPTKIETNFADEYILVNDKGTPSSSDSYKTLEEAREKLENFKSKKLDKKNQFLQLLNKDNNWVTFFIKSIIQDSAKKGYEKVLFPTGNTASKVEGHTTLEEFKKQKEDRIKELEEKKKTASNNKPWLVSEITGNKKHYFNTEEEANEFRRTNGRENFYSAAPTSSLKDSLKNIEDINKEIEQLKQELERVEREGFGALKPIYNFYENTVTNILKKQGYNPTIITDEYGNTWNEVEINEKDAIKTIAFSKKNPNELSFIPENESEVKDWFSKNLPQVPREVVDTLIDVNNRRVDAWGYFFNNIITVVKNAQKGTSYHEAFHAVYRNMLTTQERIELLIEATEKYGMPTDAEIKSLMRDYGVTKNFEAVDQEPYINLWHEEKLADDFADYVNTVFERKNDSVFKKIANFFKKILGLFGIASSVNTGKINRVFSKINSGYYANVKYDSRTDAILAAEPAFSRKQDIPNVGPNYKLMRAKSIADQFRVKFLTYKQLKINKTPNEIINEIWDEYFRRASTLLENKTPENIKKLQNMMFMIAGPNKDAQGRVLSKDEKNAIVKKNRQILLSEVTDILREQGIILKLNTNEAIELTELQPISQEDIENSTEEDIQATQKDSHTTKGFSDYTSIPGMSHASTRLKLVLSTLQKYKEGTTEFEYDDIGDPIYIDMKKVYYYVERNLIDLYNLEDQINELEQLTTVFPELQQIIDLLTDPSKHASEQEFKMFRNDFKTNFTKQQLKYLLVLIDKSTGEVKIVNSNRRDIMLELSKEWESNLNRNDKHTIAEFNKETDTFNYTANAKTEALSNSWSEMLGNSSEEEIPLEYIDNTLIKLGIELSNSTLKLLGEKKKELVNNVTELIKYRNNSEPSNDESRKYNNARSYFLKAETNNRLDLFTSSFNDADNKNIYTIQLPSFGSELVAKLTTLEESEFRDFFNNLIKDPKYKHSNLLKKLASDQKVGTRDLRKDIFNLFIIDGIKNASSQKGSKYINMGLKDYVFNDLTLFANDVANESDEKKRIGVRTSKHSFLIQADKNLQTVFEVPVVDVKVNSAGKLTNSEVTPIHKAFRSVITGEIGRIKQALETKRKIQNNETEIIDGVEFTWSESYKLKHFHYQKDPSKWDGLGFKFHYIPSLNNIPKGFKLNNEGKQIDLTLTDRIIEFIEENPNLNEEEVINEFLTDIDLGITNYLNEKLAKQLNQLVDVGLLKYNEKEGYMNFGLPRTILKLSKNDNTSLKIQEAIAYYTFNKLLSNIELSNLLNGDVAMYKANDLIKRTYQGNSMTSKGNLEGTVKMAFVNDVESKLGSSLENEFIPAFKESLKKQIANGILTEEEAQSLLESQGEVNYTDATSWILPEFLKRYQEARGVYDEGLDIALKIDSGEIVNPTKEQLNKAKGKLKGEKTFYFGVEWSPIYKMYVPIQHKTFLVPLTNAVLEYNPILKKKAQEMREKGIEILATNSAMKAFLPNTNNINEELSAAFDFPIKNLGLQQDNVQHMVDEENDAQRQIKMLMHGSIDFDKVYSLNGKEIKGENLFNMLDSLEATNYNEASKEMDNMINKKNGEFLIKLHESLTRRNATEAIHKIFEVVDGQFVFPLYTGLVNRQGQNMIMSMFTKEVTKQKFRGGSAVSMSSMGFAFKNLKEQQKAVEENDYAKAVQSELKVVFNEDGTIKHYEAAMPPYSELFYDENGKLKDIKDIPEEHRTMLVYRIPTEEIHSVIPVVVTSFLDEKVGNFMLLPTQITTQLGEDFDFDKRYFFYKHYIKTSKGEVIIPTYLSGTDTGSTKKRYEIYKQIERRKHNKLLEKAKEMSLGETMAEMLKFESRLISLEDFSKLPVEEQNSKEARDNQILSIYETILRDKSNYKSFFTKSNFEKLSEIAKQFFKNKEKYFEEFNITDQEEKDYFTAAFQNYTKVNNSTGKGLKGQSANHVTAHSLFTKMGVTLKKKTIKIAGWPKNFISTSKKTTPIEYNNLSNIYASDGTKIGDKLGQVLAAVLDDLKDPKLNFLGLNNSTIDTYALLIRLGVSEVQAIGILHSHVIKDISKKLEENNSQNKEGTEGYFTLDTAINLNEVILSKLENKFAKQVVEKNSTNREYLKKKPRTPFIKFNNGDLNIKGKTTKFWGINETEEFYIANMELIKGITDAKNEFELKTALDKAGASTNFELQESLMQYFLSKQRLTLAFKGMKTFADGLVKLNKAFALNKELGPDIETVLEKLYIFNSLENLPFEITSISKSVKALIKAAEKELEYLSKEYPYASTTYASVKEAYVDMQVKRYSEDPGRDYKLANNIKKDLRVKMNEMLDFYLRLKSDVFSSSMEREEAIRLILEVPKKFMEFKSKSNIEKYGNLREQPLFSFLQVTPMKVNKTNTKVNYIKFKGNRHDTSVKNAFTRSMLELYQNPNKPEYRDFIVDLIKYSHLVSGFTSATDSFHTLIDPDILMDLGLPDHARKTLNTLNNNKNYYGVLSETETEKFLELMIRNRPKEFTKVVSDKIGTTTEEDGKVYFTVDAKKNKGTREAFNLEIGIGSVNDEELVLYSKFIRVKRKGAKEELFKLVDNDTNIKVYERIPYYGVNGFLYEMYNDLNAPSIVSANNYTILKEDNDSSTGKEVIMDATEYLFSQGLLDPPQNEAPGIDSPPENYGEIEYAEEEDDELAAYLNRQMAEATEIDDEMDMPIASLRDEGPVEGEEEQCE